MNSFWGAGQGASIPGGDAIRETLPDLRQS